MRTIYPNNEIYHIWSSSTTGAGRNSSNTMSFDHNIAYSYRFCIGTQVYNKAREAYFILSVYKYSTPTSKHQSQLRTAVTGKGAIVLLPVRFSRNTSIREIILDLESYFMPQITELQLKLGTANRVNKARYRAKIDSLQYEYHNCVRGLNEAFDEDFPIPEVTPSCGEDMAIVTESVGDSETLNNERSENPTCKTTGKMIKVKIKHKHLKGIPILACGWFDLDFSLDAACMKPVYFTAGLDMPWADYYHFGDYLLATGDTFPKGEKVLQQELIDRLNAEIGTKSEDCDASELRDYIYVVLKNYLHFNQGDSE